MAADRQRCAEQRKGGRKKGWRGEKQSDESHKGVPLYVRTSLPPLSVTLSLTLKAEASIPAHFCWHASAAQKKTKKQRRGYLCAGALQSDLGCSPPCGSLWENKSRQGNTENVSPGLGKKKKKKLAEIRNAEPNMRTEVQVD